MSTWHSDVPYDLPRPQGFGAWARVVRRGIPVLAITALGLLLLLLLRLVERPLWGLRRPWTPWITVAVCRINLRLLGLRHTVQGRPQGAALVANHSSWLDIFTLNATTPLYFVAKADVSGWPGIGWLARATGTVFVVRKREEAQRQATLLAKRLDAGHRLLLFPEGTTSDSQRILPFKSSLLGVPGQVQPVSVVYEAPPGADARFYGWWGDMDLGPHALALLAQPQQGRVSVTFHAPLAPADRKTLAVEAETVIRAQLEQQIGVAL